MDVSTILSEPELAQQIVACTPDAVIFTDPDGVIRLWNAAAEAIFGHSEEEALGRPLELIIPEPLRARHNEGYCRVMQTGVTQYGGRRLLAVPAMRKDGARISAGARGIPSPTARRPFTLRRAVPALRHRPLHVPVLVTTPAAASWSLVA